VGLEMRALIQAILRRVYDSFLSSLWRFHLSFSALQAVSTLCGGYCDSLSLFIALCEVDSSQLRAQGLLFFCCWKNVVTHRPCDLHELASLCAGPTSGQRQAPNFSSVRVSFGLWRM